jgi:hypothetical protein
MGFDPRRWRPSSGSRPLTTNVEALLAENDALRREVRSLRLQLEAFLQGEPAASRSGEPGPTSWAESSRAASGAARAEAEGSPWSSTARSRASRPSWSSAEPPPRSRVTVGSSHGLSPDLVERWGRSLAIHPRWQALRIGPPGGLRGLEEELRRHWWNPALSLEQELDRRCPGLGHELFEALRGPHSRGRWAVRAAFALYGPRAPEWLSEEPLRVVDDLLRRVQQLEQTAGSGPRRGGTRTASASGAEGPEPQGRSADRRSAGAGPKQSDASGRRAGGSGGARQQGARQQGDGQRPPHGTGQHAPHDGGQRAPHDGGGHHQGQQRSGSPPPGRRRAASVDPRAEALSLLGLEHGASEAAIKRAYRRLAKAHHPDLGGDAEAFRRLDAAYRLLR